VAGKLFFLLAQESKFIFTNALFFRNFLTSMICLEEVGWKIILPYPS